jgi:hypothetical protein
MHEDSDEQQEVIEVQILPQVKCNADNSGWPYWASFGLLDDW